MFAIYKARIGTSPAARRVDALAHAIAAQREAECRRHPPVIIETDPVTPTEGDTCTARQWAAEQVATWAERQPHIVVVFKARWRTIAEEVAARYGVTVDDMIGSGRKADFIDPRFEAMFRILDETPLSLPEIGRRFGGRDHTTVLHAVRTHAARNGLPIPRQDEEAS